MLKVIQTQGRLGPIPPSRLSPSYNNFQQFNIAGSASQPCNPPANFQPLSKQGARISPTMPHSPVPDPIQLLMQQQNQQQSQNQLHIPPGANSLGVRQVGSRNTLSVSPGPGPHQRVPSPQELVLHTQQIMHNALIKRKLEEQKENYRRRLDHQNSGPFRERSNSDSQDTGNGNTCGESPFAFTPMSVMKKMAADRRDSDPKVISVPELKLSQATSDLPDEIIGKRVIMTMGIFKLLR